MNDREQLEKALNELKASFWDNKNGIWFLFGIWVGFAIVAILYFLNLI